MTLNVRKSKIQNELFSFQQCLYWAQSQNRSIDKNVPFPLHFGQICTSVASIERLPSDWIKFKCIITLRLRLLLKRLSLLKKSSLIRKCKIILTLPDSAPAVDSSCLKYFVTKYFKHTTIVNVLKRVLLIAKSFSKIFSKPPAYLEDHHFCFDTCLFCDVNFFQICKQTFWLWLAPSNYTCSPDGHFLAKSFKIFYCVCRIFTNFWTFCLCLHVIKFLNFLNMQGNYCTAKQSFRPSDVE